MINKFELVALLAAPWPVTFVATKVTKNASADRLLCRTGLRPANRSEPRAAIICPASRPLVPASAKLAMPFHHTKPASFCPFSPEADLLGGSVTS